MDRKLENAKRYIITSRLKEYEELTEKIRYFVECGDCTKCPYYNGLTPPCSQLVAADVVRLVQLIR